MKMINEINAKNILSQLHEVSESLKNGNYSTAKKQLESAKTSLNVAILMTKECEIIEPATEINSAKSGDIFGGGSDNDNKNDFNFSDIWKKSDRDILGLY